MKRTFTILAIIMLAFIADIISVHHTFFLDRQFVYIFSNVELFFIFIFQLLIGLILISLTAVIFYKSNYIKLFRR